MHIELPKTNVPIIGQPALCGWVLIVHFMCPCEKHTPLMIVGMGNVVHCPACHQGWVVGSFNHNVQTNQGQIQFGHPMVERPS